MSSGGASARRSGQTIKNGIHEMSGDKMREIESEGKEAEGRKREGKTDVITGGEA